MQYNYGAPLVSTCQLQVSDGAKLGPAEELAELQRRRDQLDAEIAQLEAEWVQLRVSAEQSPQIWDEIKVHQYM